MKAPDPWCATGRQPPAISDDRQLRLAWRALVDAQLAMLSRASQAIPAELRLMAKRPGWQRRSSGTTASAAPFARITWNR